MLMPADFGVILAVDPLAAGDQSEGNPLGCSVEEDLDKRIIGQMTLSLDIASSRNVYASTADELAHTSIIWSSSSPGVPLIT